MKWLDLVKVKCSKEKYEKEKVFKGAIGTIIMSEIRSNCFEVVFSDREGKDYAQIEINIKDLEVIKESSVTNEEILKDLPLQNPKWWCKVEDGFIVNLLGEKKNKIAYDYNS